MHSSLWILVTHAGQHKDTVAYIYLQWAAADGSPALIFCQFHDGGTMGKKATGKRNEWFPTICQMKLKICCFLFKAMNKIDEKAWL